MTQPSQSLLMPTHLQVNLVPFAYNVGHSPKFSWWDHSDRDASYQQAFQIVVANRLYQLADKTYRFDSGWVSSANNTAVSLPDLDHELAPGELYYWQVRIKDNAGNVSDFSEPNKFICAQAPAVNHGIWSPTSLTVGESLPTLGNVAFLRSPQFKVDLKKVDTAIVTAISRGNEPLFAQGADLFLNGHSIGIGSARPQDNYQGGSKTGVYYNQYDVTDRLVAGANVLSALATGASERRAFWCALTVYLTDGTQKIILTTDTGWRALDGSSAFGDYGLKIRSIYFGMIAENVDMRYYPSKWATVDFDDHEWPQAWTNPEPVINDQEIAIPYRSENTVRIENHEPTKRIQELAPQNYLIDLGKEIIGSLTVNFDSPTAQRVTVLMGEQLEPNGHVRHPLAAGPDYLENWTLVAGQNTFTTFQMKNFRYIELVGLQGTLHPDDINGWAMQQPFNEDESAFTSDNQLLNREYEMSKYTIKATNQDVFVDSQARERRPYEGDLLVNGLTSFAVSSNYSLDRHSLDYLIDNPTWPEDYKLFNVEMAWLDYLYTGNRDLLESRYEQLTYKLNRGKSSESFDGASQGFTGSLKNIKGVDNFDETVGLVTNDGLIDWPIPERDGFIEGKYNTPFNAIFYGAYRMMSQIAKVTGHDQDVSFYEKRADRIKAELINRLYDAESGRFYDSLNADLTVNQHTSHHASAYALCYGVYSDQLMADKLSKFVANQGHFIGSVYFIYFMLKGLIDAGHADDAIALLTNPDDRKDQKTFAAILNTLKATIAPEAWSNHYKPNMTLSHPWGATPGLTIVQGIMGINPIEPGFNTFRIKVRPGNLKKLQVTTPSPKGLIKVAYQRNGLQAELVAEVPMNAQAELVLPEEATDIQITGTTNQLAANNNSTINLASGKYRISYHQN